MPDVLTIEIGQAGIQLGNAIWEQYCAEHDIDNTGKRKDEKSRDDLVTVFFEETNDGHFIPRNLARDLKKKIIIIKIDLEPSVIDNVINGPFAALFSREFLLSGKEDAANNFARGFYSIGGQIIDKVNDKIRKRIEHFDYLMGFMIVHSVGGGTGSGLSSLILEHLAVDYKKKEKIGFDIYPSPTLSTCVTEPYNALLATHWLIDHTDISLVLDNEAIYGLCQNKLFITKPDINNLNRLISKVISSMTTSLRFRAELNVYLDEYSTSLVAFQRLHFLTTGMSPIVPKTHLSNISYTLQDIVDQCFKPSNWLVQYTNFDPAEDKYMAFYLNFRGDVKSKEANAEYIWLKINNKISLVEWCPTGCKMNLDQIPAATLEVDDIGAWNKNTVIIANNTAIYRMFNKRIVEKFDYLYSQRAFVHWYVQEKMEETEFLEAREDLKFLEKDYFDVLSDIPTDYENIDIDCDYW
ncbi:tubulin alpha-1 chain [Reticulomyxa filosa]|uniref:Tubulin alpha chain n=1 Tax=Reticulomyxa filosa TaxID=46433 RepID=X6P7P1_RETFI|nr:tubulin alpha-1 chain [Reticulomyxa filosa]|eukprot:ETO34084.1 tubulin alpha-1 chain [Reticulomyxa filosa]